jgi:hypothetical protein
MKASGLMPDPWQAEILRTASSPSNSEDLALCCSRQVGKTQTIGALILLVSLVRPNTFTLIISPSERQSSELLKWKVLPLWKKLGQPLGAKANSKEIEFTNGSRVLALPSNADTIMGFSGVNFLVIDEAARVKDELYFASRPFVAAVQGKIISMSTPHGRRGWFFELWHSPEKLIRTEITADKCARLTPEFLARELRRMGEQWFNSEYRCIFSELLGSMFRQEDIDYAMMPHGVKPLVLA